MTIPTHDHFLKSLYKMWRGARVQLELAGASGNAEHIESWCAIVAQCEDTIRQAGGRINA